MNQQADIITRLRDREIWPLIGDLGNEAAVALENCQNAKAETERELVRAQNEIEVLKKLADEHGSQRTIQALRGSEAILDEEVEKVIRSLRVTLYATGFDFFKRIELDAPPQ